MIYNSDCIDVPLTLMNTSSLKEEHVVSFFPDIFFFTVTCLSLAKFSIPSSSLLSKLTFITVEYPGWQNSIRWKSLLTLRDVINNTYFTNFLYHYQRNTTYQLSVVVGTACAINGYKSAHDSIPVIWCDNHNEDLDVFWVTPSCIQQDKPVCIQRFRERLSYRRDKA